MCSTNKNEGLDCIMDSAKLPLTPSMYPPPILVAVPVPVPVPVAVAVAVTVAIVPES